METLYRSQDLIAYETTPYKIFHSRTRDEKMDKYARQFYALNDYAYFVAQSVNDETNRIENYIKDINNWIQNPNLDEETADEFVGLYLGKQEDRNLLIPLVEQISINTIIMCLLSFYEGVLKEITYEFIKKLDKNTKIKTHKIDEYLKLLKRYDNNNLLEKVEKDNLIIKQAKRIRNTFVHEQWMTFNNNVWYFKTGKELRKLSIASLINAITNMIETIEMIGIENKIYKTKY